MFWLGRDSIFQDWCQLRGFSCVWQRNKNNNFIGVCLFWVRKCHKYIPACDYLLFNLFNHIVCKFWKNCFYCCLCCQIRLFTELIFRNGLFSSIFGSCIFLSTLANDLRLSIDCTPSCSDLWFSTEWVIDLSDETLLSFFLNKEKSEIDPWNYLRLDSGQVVILKCLKFFQ